MIKLASLILTAALMTGCASGPRGPAAGQLDTVGRPLSIWLDKTVNRTLKTRDSECPEYREISYKHKPATRYVVGCNDRIVAIYTEDAPESPLYAQIVQVDAAIGHERAAALSASKVTATSPVRTSVQRSPRLRESREKNG